MYELPVDPWRQPNFSWSCPVSGCDLFLQTRSVLEDSVFWVRRVPAGPGSGSVTQRHVEIQPLTSLRGFPKCCGSPWASRSRGKSWHTAAVAAARACIRARAFAWSELDSRGNMSGKFWRPSPGKGNRWAPAALTLLCLGLVASCCGADEASCHGAYDLYFVLDR